MAVGRKAGAATKEKLTEMGINFDNIDFSMKTVPEFEKYEFFNAEKVFDNTIKFDIENVQNNNYVFTMESVKNNVN